jgi:hypothetical protein
MDPNWKLVMSVADLELKTLHSGSRIVVLTKIFLSRTYIKRGMKNKNTFFLEPYGFRKE